MCVNKAEVSRVQALKFKVQTPTLRCKVVASIRVVMQISWKSMQAQALKTVMLAIAGLLLLLRY